MKSPISNLQSPGPRAMDEEYDERCQGFILRERAASEAREHVAWESGLLVGRQIERDRQQHLDRLRLLFTVLLSAMAGLALGALITKFW